MSLFRFQDLEIWRRAIALAGPLCALAEQLDAAKCWKFAEQLRAAALSISNNIAEGSGSHSRIDFAHFLNMAKRSSFECANMMLFFEAHGYLAGKSTEPNLVQLNELARMIEAFRQNLLQKATSAKNHPEDRPVKDSH